MPPRCQLPPSGLHISTTHWRHSAYPLSALLPSPSPPIASGHRHGLARYAFLTWLCSGPSTLPAAISTHNTRPDICAHNGRDHKQINTVLCGQTGLKLEVSTIFQNLVKTASSGRGSNEAGLPRLRRLPSVRGAIRQSGAWRRNHQNCSSPCKVPPQH